MIYLVITLIVCQVIHFIFYQKILLTVKRRYRIIDARVRNLSQWIISNDQSITQHLQKINELVHGLHSKTGMQNGNTANTQPADTCESASLSMHMQVSHKQALEKSTSEDIYQYYALLLHELQQLDNSIHKVRHQPESTSQANNPVNTSLFKKEMLNRLNGLTG